MPKNMLGALATDPPSTITTTYISLIDHEENISSEMPTIALNHERNVISRIDYKLTIDKDTQLERHHTVEGINSKCLIFN